MLKNFISYIPKASCWLTAAVINVPLKTWKSFFLKCYIVHTNPILAITWIRRSTKFYSSVILLWESRRTQVYLIEGWRRKRCVLSDYWYVMFCAMFLSLYTEYSNVWLYIIQHGISIKEHVVRPNVNNDVYLQICHYSVNYVIYWISRENEWSPILCIAIFSLRWGETCCWNCFGLKVTLHDFV